MKVSFNGKAKYNETLESFDYVVGNAKFNNVISTINELLHSQGELTAKDNENINMIIELPDR